MAKQKGPSLFFQRFVGYCGTLLLKLPTKRPRIRRMNKHDFIQKVKALEGISQDERAYLIDLINTKKKYGLVWEDKPEDVEETLRTHLPVLQEVVEKRIIAPNSPLTLRGSDPNGGISFDTSKKTTSQPTLFDSPPTLRESDRAADRPEGGVKNAELSKGEFVGTPPLGAGGLNHSLIEGDNLHALTALTFTHENKIDVIYIDPPYNTGNKDFKYNDSFVDREDSYRHSKWLSFMDKRLRIAKRLLSDKGVIFISIDDNEQAQLKLLCDEVFMEANFIAQIIWQKRISPDSRRILGPAHDNIYCYGKSYSSYLGLNHLALTEEQENAFKNPDNDPRGAWVSSDYMAQGFRPNQVYEIVTPGGAKYSPPEGKCWKNIEDVFKKQMKEGRMWFGIDGKGIPRRKTYLIDRKGSVPWTWWDYKSSGNNQDAKKEITEILGKATAFSTPKPLMLIRKVLEIASNTDSTILDFFAGSGTTLHATMALNAEDGGNRQCILVTNNENNICEEVTYERNKRVIEGYTNAKGAWVEGLGGNNLRYYRGGFVPSLKSEANKRLLTQASTELLCLKENCYNELTAEYALDPRQARIFRDDFDVYMVVVYHSRQQAEVCEALVGIIQGVSSTQKIKVYGFSPEKDTLVEEFYGVQDRIEAIPLPDAIYNAYKATFRIIGLDKKQL
ncbi:MAG: site-specific DNA-methyltransferase [Runella sp.]